MGDPPKRTLLRGDPALDATVDDSTQGSLPKSAPPSSISKSAISPSARIGRYVVLRKLGEGGMGVVYAAYDEELDRKVAVKLLRDTGPESQDRRARILREAQAMARVSHPNVVSVYEVGEVNGRVFIAMEFVEGTTLTAWQEPGRLWSDVLRVYLAAAEGLAAAHQAGLVHRDFKPDNVLLGSDGRPRVADFGLARSESAELSTDGIAAIALDGDAGAAPPTAGALLQSPLTLEGTILGTPAYMSPEQHAGQAADSRSDQWSFCAALYEALFAQMPFPGESLLALRFNVLQGRLRQVPPNSPVPRQIERALRRGLSVAAGERFASMKELIAALSIDVLRDPSAVPLARRIFTFSLAGGILASAVVMGLHLMRGTLTARTLFVSALVSLFAMSGMAFWLRDTLLKNSFHRNLVRQVLIITAQIACFMGMADFMHLTITQVFSIDMVMMGGSVAMITLQSLPSGWWVMVLCFAGALSKLFLPPNWLLPVSVALYPALTIGLAIEWNRAANKQRTNHLKALHDLLKTTQKC